MNDIVLGMTFQIDGKEAVGTIRVARSELAAMRDEQGKNAKATNDGREAAEKYVKAIKEKFETLGFTRAEMRRYEMAQLQLSDAERRAVEQMDQAIERHKQIGDLAERAGRAIGGMAVAAATGAAAVAGMIKKEAIAAAIEAAEANVRLESTLKATGYAAGLTKKQLNDLADGLAESTRFDDEGIRAAIAVMLRFKDVQGDAFTTAIKLAADFAESSNTDIKGAAEAIGRALQDPDHAMRLLVQTGGRFNEQTRETVKSLIEQGRTAEAQAMILDRLKASVGGTAEAMNTGLMRASADVKKGWQELMEALGQTDAVGGRAQRGMEGISQILRDVKDQVNGTSNQFIGFFAQLETGIGVIDAASVALKVYLERQARAATAGNAVNGRVVRVDAEKGEAERGRINQEIARAREAAALAEKKRNEELQRAADAYAKVTAAAADYLTSLELQRDGIGATTEQKIMLTAAQRALTLATEKERMAFLASAVAIASDTQRREEKLKADKDLEEAAKRAVEQREREFAALTTQIEKQKEHNYELVNGKGSWDAYKASMVDAEIVIAEVTGASEEEIAVLRKKSALLKELASQQAAGADIEAQQKAQKKFMEDAERDAQRYGQVLEDAITKALFDGGKNGKQILEGIFRSTVLQPQLNLMTQGISNALYGTGGASGAGGTGSLGGLGSIFNLFGGSSALGTFGNGMTYGGSAGLGTTLSGLGQGSLAFDAGSLMGAAGPYAAAAIAAYQLYQNFADKGENPKYRIGFGSAAQGYASDSVFGRQGFQYAQGNDAANQGFRAAQQGTAGLDRQIAGLMTTGQISAATSRLNGVTGREFSFPKGDGTASEQLLLEYTKLKYSAVFADFNSKISETIANFSGKSDDLIKYIGEQVTAYEALQASIDQITASIDGMDSNGLRALNRTLDVLRTNVEETQAAWVEAMAGSDPKAQVEAQNALVQAIQNRYNTEMQMIRQLSDQLDQIRSNRYDFGNQMAGRYSSVGRLRVNAEGAAARGRQLDSQIEGESDPARRLGYINQALAVVDDQVRNYRAVMDDIFGRQAQRQQEMVDRQTRANEARLQQLNDELETMREMKGVADEARKAIEGIRYSAASPVSAQGRYALAGQDLESLQQQFRGSSGSQRADLASRIITAVQNRVQMLGGIAQRPTDEYTREYNAAMAALDEVQSAAVSESAQLLSNQEEIKQINQSQRDLTENLVDYAALERAAIDTYNASALERYQSLDEQAQAAYDLMQTSAEEQFDVATRHLGATEAIRQLNEESRNLLIQIRDGQTGATGANVTVTVVVPPGTGTSTGAGGTGSGPVVLTPQQILNLEQQLQPVFQNLVSTNRTFIRNEVANA